MSLLSNLPAIDGGAGGIDAGSTATAFTGDLELGGITFGNRDTTLLWFVAIMAAAILGVLWLFKG